MSTDGTDACAELVNGSQLRRAVWSDIRDVGRTNVLSSFESSICERFNIYIWKGREREKFFFVLFISRLFTRTGERKSNVRELRRWVQVFAEYEDRFYIYAKINAYSLSPSSFRLTHPAINSSLLNFRSPPSSNCPMIWSARAFAADVPCRFVSPVRSYWKRLELDRISSSSSYDRFDHFRQFASINLSVVGNVVTNRDEHFRTKFSSLRSTHMSNAAERRSPRSPCPDAATAMRNSSKSIVPSSFVSNASNAYLNAESHSIGRTSNVSTPFTCNRYRPCRTDRAFDTIRWIAFYLIDRWDNHEWNPRRFERQNSFSRRKMKKSSVPNRMPLANF